MTITEKARLMVTEAKQATTTFKQAMQVIQTTCAALPAGRNANEIHDAAIGILFSEMYDSPHGGAQECIKEI
ncbi:hypothetical protein [Bacillus sp. FJAT-26390]|uniref:hypothetical protein n=1 Tax=Bacillus sp. FJAT-26390 TaxID=1743142 RepID=UPI00080803D4|nr:hypothetical protein [Bacillus sp. FJAT-26390]OBZ08026.1 hypothetical protein A7975_27235 [Bacillus sp. FJAT-26390]